ncbi:type II secretion system protein [bacterium]|nr:type II secretion system protein [bacterium]
MFKHKNSASFTLFELILSITLMGIVSGLLSSIIAINFSTMSDVSDRKKLITRGLLAINLFQREFGMLKKTDDILVAAAKQLKFTDAYGNTWDYTISGNSLNREEVGGGAGPLTLATPVLTADTEFNYFAEDNSIASSIAQIRLVKLMLVMDDANTGIPLMSIVYPENMKVYNYPLD